MSGPLGVSWCHPQSCLIHPIVVCEKRTYFDPGLQIIEKCIWHTLGLFTTKNLGD